MKLITTILTFALTATAYADLICTADSVGLGQKTVVLTIDSAAKTATVQVGEDVNTITIDHSMWDGHVAGLMTGKGFAFMYQNHFGCIRNAELTALLPHGFGKVSFSSCNGGSTPDNICFQ